MSSAQATLGAGSRPTVGAPVLVSNTPTLAYPSLSTSSALLQHSPVYTVGKRGNQADFLADPAALGAEVFVVPRGGETTFHGPGQLVVYPIVSLRQLGVGARAYVEGLEDVLVRTLGQHGISARVSHSAVQCCVCEPAAACILPKFLGSF